jgi:hypothetical protein
MRRGLRSQCIRVCIPAERSGMHEACARGVRHFMQAQNRSWLPPSAAEADSCCY